MTKKFTILGGSGFIGTNLARYLRSRGNEVLTPARADLPHVLSTENLGHVIYAIGMTGNFRLHPRETIEAQVDVLTTCLSCAKNFDSWLYLSSTRVYSNLPKGETGREDSLLPVAPSADSLYDLSKLLGESFCLAQSNPHIRAVRLSNVYGIDQSAHTFLGAVMDEAISSASAMIGESPDSSKDYVSIEDVVAMIEKIAVSGKHRLYNLASGHNIMHKDLADAIIASGYHVSFAEGGATRTFPPVDITRLKEEFGYAPASLLSDVLHLLSDRKELS